jgi:TetR/AcrR family transcriptional repressor of mexJK operon
MLLRHRTERKRDAMLAAGRTAFLGRGYRDASMDSIARQAAVSKRTLYAHFESKESLFLAIVREACDQMVEPIARTRRTADVEATLTALGRQFIGLALSPWLNSLHRLVVAESVRFPELGRLYYGVVRERLWDAIAGYLDEQARRGVLRIERPELAAEQFCAILGGHPHVRLQLGIDRRRSKRAMADDVKFGVRLFLDGCRAQKRA